MNPWRQFPILRLIIPLCFGIATGIFYVSEFKVPLIIPILLFICFGGLVFVSRFTLSYSFRWICGMLAFSLMILLALRLIQDQKDILRRDYFGNFQSAKRYCIAEIIEPVVQKQKSTKLIVKVTGLNINGKWHTTEGNAVVVIAKSALSQNLFYGDWLVMFAQFTLPDGPLNPGGFDNRRYLSLKGIYRQSYVKADQWKFLSGGNRNPVFRLALSWRDKMLMMLRGNGMKGKEFAVAGALLLGYVDEVDNDLMHDYSATGVMHILSVSGMHVGMIFLVLDKLLAFLEKRRYGIYIKTIFVILFVWIYAFITGLSPAVMRSAAMLSLMVLGKSLKRYPETLNVLAASCLLLLALQPLLLADPGFQLSYLAVTGIVLFYRPIYHIFTSGNSIIDKTWSIVAVSIAAQIVTFPLCLYYFHQFPNYFMITNIIVIPLSNLIIYAGIIALAIGKIPVIAVIIAKVLSLMVWFLNSFIHWMGALPFSVSRGINLTFAEVVILYLALITFGVFISTKKKIGLYVTVALMIIFSSIKLNETVHHSTIGTFTIYDIKKRSLFDFSAGGRSILMGDLSILKDPFILDVITKSRWNDNVTGLFSFQYPLPKVTDKIFRNEKLFIKQGNIIGFCGRKIVIIDKRISMRASVKLNVDYLVISGNPKWRLTEILQHYRAGTVIFDASNSIWKVQAWIKEAHYLGLKCHSVSLSGAWRV
jgi:competence protein ComEC